MVISREVNFLWEGFVFCIGWRRRRKRRRRRRKGVDRDANGARGD